MESTLIIAEAGVNHNGSMDLAKRLIDAAVEAGADIVKFQTFKSERLVNRSAGKAAYQAANTGDDSESQFDMLKRLELRDDDHSTLIAYCEKKGIRFLSTPFDLESIDLLRDLGITLGKIPSGEIVNLPYLRKMAASFETLILSTGMADMQEIGAALHAILDQGFNKEKLTILHCNTEYPTPFEDVHLRAMQTIRDAFGVPVGYSDHTPGIEVPVAAVALGAKVIEKHFTLDRKMEGPDHKASLEPHELKDMVQSIRNIEKALGRPDKTPSPSEIKNRTVARRSIVAARKINAGEIFTADNLAAKRPGDGISPMQWDAVIGEKASRDYQEDEQIRI